MQRPGVAWSLMCSWNVQVRNSGRVGKVCWCSDVSIGNEKLNSRTHGKRGNMKIVTRVWQLVKFSGGGRCRSCGCSGFWVVLEVVSGLAGPNLTPVFSQREENSQAVILQPQLRKIDSWFGFDVYTDFWGWASALDSKG